MSENEIKELLKSARKKVDAEDWKNAIADLDKVIDLDPYNSIALFNRGFVNYRLEKYDDAKRDFDEAFELDPEDPDINRWLSVATRKSELEKVSEGITKNLEDQAEVFTGNSVELKAERDKRSENISNLDNRIIIAWILMTGIIVFYFQEVGIIPSFIDIGIIPDFFEIGHQNTINFTSKDLYKQILPLLPPLLIILFPFIWGIRMLLSARDKNEIMREDYYRRAMADATIHSVFTNLITPNTPEQERQRLEAQRLEAWSKYIDVWLHNSSAEMLLRYSNKKSPQQDSNPTETIIREVREIVKGTEDDKGNTL